MEIAVAIFLIFALCAANSGGGSCRVNRGGGGLTTELKFGSMRSSLKAAVGKIREPSKTASGNYNLNPRSKSGYSSSRKPNNDESNGPSVIV